MGDLFGALKKVFVQSSPAPAAAPDDADFADFAAPSPASIISSLTNSIPASSSSDSPGVAASSWLSPPAYQPRPYTKWYRVWERVTLADFYSEVFILPFLIIIISIHFWGAGKNKRKATAWAKAHVPVLEQEYASVGFDARKLSSGLDPTNSMGTGVTNPLDRFKEKAANEYITYATGRQNIAFLDLKLLLSKRYNPMGRVGEVIVGFFMESLAAPKERVEATAYAFDARENDLVPQLATSSEKENFKSSFDGFVFAIVHKESMKKLRESRYDLSLTSTKDNAKLPAWATVMSESAEISDAILTSEVIKAVEQAGELLEAIIITDQPIDQPKKLNDVQSRKRLTLILNLPNSDSSSAYEATLPLFRLFLRLPDVLVSSAHYRPEAMRRVKATREEEIKKIRKLEEDERADDRRAKFEKQKKEERERMLNNMSAQEQRKFREKENTNEIKKGQKKRSMRA